MNRTEIKNRVENVFKDIFDDKSIIISDDTTAKDIEGWDSLTHISLIAAIEEEFDIRLNMSDVIKFENVGDLLDTIEDKV